MGQIKPAFKGKEQAKPAPKATFQQPAKQPQKTPVQPTKAAPKK